MRSQGSRSRSSRCRSPWRSPSLRASRPTAGFTPRSSAASSSRRSAAAVFRSAARPAPSSCSSRQPSQQHGVDGLILATFLVRRHPRRDRLSAARHLHQIHPLSGHGRLHLAASPHHLREPDQGASRPLARRRGARRHSSPSSRRSAQALPTLQHRGRGGRRLLAIGVIVALRRWRPHWPAFLIAVGARVSRSLGCCALPVETHRHPLRRLPRSSRPRTCRPSRSPRSPRCCRPRSPSRFSARSKACFRPWSPTACPGAGIAPMPSSSPRASPTWRPRCSAASASRARSRAPPPMCAPARAVRSPACCIRVFVLLFMIVAAPLASYIPLAALGAVLAVVCWNMAEKHCFATLLRASRGDARGAPRDLPPRGVPRSHRRASWSASASARSSSCIAWRKRSRSRAPRPSSRRTRPTTCTKAAGNLTTSRLATDPDMLVYRISGAFFFGAAASVAAALDRIGEHPKAYVIDFSAVPVIDSTAAATIAGFARKATRGKAKRLYRRRASRRPAHPLDARSEAPARALQGELGDALSSARQDSIRAARTATPRPCALRLP